MLELTNEKNKYKINYLRLNKKIKYYIDEVSSITKYI